MNKMHIIDNLNKLFGTDLQIVEEAKKAYENLPEPRTLSLAGDVGPIVFYKIMQMQLDCLVDIGRDSEDLRLAISNEKRKEHAKVKGYERWTFLRDQLYGVKSLIKNMEKWDSELHWHHVHTLEQLKKHGDPRFNAVYDLFLPLLDEEEINQIKHVSGL